MPYNGGKSKTLATKRHFTVVIGNKENGLYVSTTPSSAARKAVTKLCASNKSKKVEFHIREITQGSKKKTYGPYIGHIEKLKEPIELKGRTIEYKPMAKLKGKKMSGGSYDISLTIDGKDKFANKDKMRIIDNFGKYIPAIYKNKNGKDYEIEIKKSNEQTTYIISFKNEKLLDWFKKNYLSGQRIIPNSS
jgi:hypothetical protein